MNWNTLAEADQRMAAITQSDATVQKLLEQPGVGAPR